MEQGKVDLHESLKLWLVLNVEAELWIIPCYLYGTCKLRMERI